MRCRLPAPKSSALQLSENKKSFPRAFQDKSRGKGGNNEIKFNKLCRQARRVDPDRSQELLAGIYCDTITCWDGTEALHYEFTIASSSATCKSSLGGAQSPCEWQ
jgi:hypothetical protein